MPLSADTPKPDDGRPALAARVAELAQAHGMKVSKTADLATLLEAIRVSDPIPIAAFGVIAEVLFAILNADRQPEHGESTP